MPSNLALTHCRNRAGRLAAMYLHKTTNHVQVAPAHPDSKTLALHLNKCHFNHRIHDFSICRIAEDEL